MYRNFQDVRVHNLKKIESKNGITLIALIVTIIILLILAGISISALKSSELFEKVKLAKNKTEDVQELENHVLLEYENQISDLDNFSNNEDDLIEFENNLESHWPLKDSLENKKSEYNNLVIYSGNNLKFEEESAYISSTILTTEKIYYLLPEKFTIMFKYKPAEELKPWTLIFGKNTSYSNISKFNGLFIHNTLDKTGLFNGYEEEINFSINEILKVGEYSTIAITYDGTTSKLYSNSKLVTQIAGWNDLNDRLFIGGNQYSGTKAGNVPWGYANGYFKDIRIYNTVLPEKYLKK